MIPRASIDKVLEEADIAQVIGHYLPLRRRGKEYVALCAFHDEKTPSLHVHPEKRFFKCFGCGAGGDALSFVRRYLNVGFREAVLILARYTNVHVEIGSGATRAPVPKLSNEQRLGRLIEEARCRRLRFDPTDAADVRSIDVNRAIEQYARETGALLDREGSFVWERCSPHDKDPMWQLCLQRAALESLGTPITFEWVCGNLAVLLEKDRAFAVRVEDRAAELIHELAQ